MSIWIYRPPKNQMSPIAKWIRFALSWILLLVAIVGLTPGLYFFIAVLGDSPRFHAADYFEMIAIMSLLSMPSALFTLLAMAVRR
jgi:hypothetical protein